VQTPPLPFAASGSQMVDFLSLHTAHASARRFTCPLQCGYAGRDRTAMRAHQQSMHSTERPYVCFCSYAAKTKWALDTHKKRKHNT